MLRYFSFIALFSASALADEGMWTMDNFPSDKVEEAYGVTIDQAWLDRARLATVRLTGPGGCTGSIVSPNGLILTNRHCVEDCLAEHTSEEVNVWENGHYARHPGEEKRCSATQAAYLADYEDVTDQVHAATEGLDEVEANQVRKQTLTRLEQACEETSEGALKCQIVNLYKGGQYFLYKYRRYDDIRLVFAPDIKIGVFGGDPDNFNFPRWTLDMAFLRARGEDGPAATENYLTWRAEGPEIGEAVFVTGHPGSTSRLLTVAELEFLRETARPLWLLRYAELRGRYRQFAREDEEAYRIVQRDLKRLENGIKVRRNEIAALLDERLMAAKRADEAALREAVASDPDLAGTVYAWHQIEDALDAYGNFYERYILVEGRGGLQGSLFTHARDLVRAAEEREKPSAERYREFRDTALPLVEQRVLAPVPIHRRLEEMQIAYGLEKMRELLGHDDPLVRKLLGNDSPKTVAARLVEGTRLDDPGYRKKLWEGGKKALRKSDDPFIRLTRAIDPDARAVRKRYEDEYQAPVAEAHEAIAAARFATLGTSVYPDATFTFRITYGDVRGWTEKGEEVYPFTRLDGAFGRATGEQPFALSEAWLKAKGELDMDTPMNYVSTLDLTGGNSGSPVIDTEGNIVGLAFDGNRHSIAGGYWYDIELNRAIAVHPAIMMEAMEKVYGAERILGELRDAAAKN
jgi:hypothetical protein